LTNANFPDSSPLEEYPNVELYWGLRCNKSSGRCQPNGQRSSLAEATIYHRPGPDWPAVNNANLTGTPSSAWEHETGCGFFDFFCNNRWHRNTLRLGSSDVYLKCPGSCNDSSQELRVTNLLGRISAPRGVWMVESSMPGQALRSWRNNQEDYRAGPLNNPDGACIRYNTVIRELSPKSSPYSSPCPLEPAYLSRSTSYTDSWNWGPGNQSPSPITAGDYKSLPSSLLWTFRPSASQANQFLDWRIEVSTPETNKDTGGGKTVFTSQSSSQMGRVMFDNQGPTINFSGNNSAYVNQNSLNFPATISDTSGVSSVAMRRSAPGNVASAGRCPASSEWEETATSNYSNPPSFNYWRVFNNLQHAKCYTFQLTAYDRPGFEVGSSNTAARLSSQITRTYLVDTTPPEPFVPNISASGLETYAAGQTVYINAQSGRSGAFTVTVDTADMESGIERLVFPNIPGMAGGGPISSRPYTMTYTWSGANSGSVSRSHTVTAVNRAGGTRSASFTVTPDTADPELQGVNNPDQAIDAIETPGNLVKLKMKSSDLLSGAGSGGFEYCTSNDSCRPADWQAIDQPSELFPCRPEMPGSDINLRAAGRGKIYRCTVNKSLLPTADQGIIYLRGWSRDNVNNRVQSPAVETANNSCPAVN
jgi:hypothetical protein